MRRAELLIVAIIAVLGCSKPPAPAPKLTQVKTLPRQVPFELTRNEKKQFVAKLKTVKPGDKIDDVVALLGLPYSSTLMVPKESDEVKGTSLHYYLKKIDTGSNELHDQYINLYFDTSNKLDEIGTNILDLPVPVAVNPLPTEAGGSRLGNLDEQSE